MKDLCQKDLAGLVKMSFDLSMKEFVQEPYTYMVDDYLEK